MMNNNEIFKQAVKMSDVPRKSSLGLFFNFAVEDSAPLVNHASDYEKNLQKEAEDWAVEASRLPKIVEDYKKKEKPKISKDILSKEQIAYLNSSINIQSYIEGYTEFSEKARDFLQKYKEMIGMYNSFQEECNAILDKKAAQLMSECFNK